MKSRTARITLAVVFLWGAAFAAMWNAVNVPLVEFSESAGSCTQVLVPSDGSIACGKLPRRYDIVWVE